MSDADNSKTPLVVRLSPSDRRFLEHICEKTKMTRSQIVRALIEGSATTGELRTSPVTKTTFEALSYGC